jgi:hypothetical protein
MQDAKGSIKLTFNQLEIMRSTHEYRMTDVIENRVPLKKEMLLTAVNNRTCDWDMLIDVNNSYFLLQIFRSHP